MEVISTLVPWLAVLACPITMFFLMRGMSGGECHKKEQAGAVNGAGDANEYVKDRLEVTR